MNKTVRILGPTFGLLKVFPKYGFTAFTDRFPKEQPEKFDFICWTGGTDISPSLYGEAPIRETQYADTYRDAREVDVWQKNRDAKKLGVCRGAQLLNVLNGGKLYQHVNNHTGPDHPIIDDSGRTTVVCTVHHQMMIPTKEARLVAWSEGVSSLRKTANGFEAGPAIEPEVVFYPEDKALCFQAHPEFGPKSCTDYFFQLVEELY